MIDNKYVDDDIDDNIDDEGTKGQVDSGTKGQVDSGTSDDDIEKLLNSLGGLDEQTLNKLSQMKDMSDLKNLDLKNLRKMFSKMNFDQSKLKSMVSKLTPEKVNEDKPLTREELRKKLREKTLLLKMQRKMK
jgi:hypothetical protein